MAEFAGHLRVRGAVRADGRSVLAAQSFRAPFHLSKAYWDGDARVLLVQVVNPTAGILAGDRLESEVVLDPGAALLVTTPSASRLFAMQGGAAICRQRFVVGAGAWLEVMPEPLVPHRGSSYDQHISLEVAADGEAFFVDQLMPGRVAHGEAWAWERLCLVTEVRLDGELIQRERFEQTGEALRRLAALAGSGDAACFANIVLISPDRRDEASWRRAVSALHGAGLWVGVSDLRRGGWSVRMIAADSVRLRGALREVRRILAASFPRLSSGTRKV